MDGSHPGRFVSLMVDTNVIIDVVTADPQWSRWSLASLEAHGDEELLINPAIFSELCFGYSSIQEVQSVIAGFGLRYLETPPEALFLAARAFRQYRTRGGNKHFVLPDFFIGGHAELIGCPILTRDVGRYRSYFPSVELISP